MHPVIKLPDDYWVFDHTEAQDPDFVCPYLYQIGRYDEVRPGMYTSGIFAGARDLHVGIDIGAPVGEPVCAFVEGVVHSMGINAQEGSYGPTIITRHDWQGRPIWALHGHLSKESLEMVSTGQAVKEGQMIATLGTTRRPGRSGSDCCDTPYHRRSLPETADRQRWPARLRPARSRRWRSR